MFKLFRESINSLFSDKMETHPSNSMNIDEEILEPYFGDPFLKQENELSQTYRKNGAIYVINAGIVTTKAFLSTHGSFMPRS